MSDCDVEISQALTPEDIDAVGRLFDAYAATLNVDLCFQDYPAERAGLPGKYAPPAGVLLLARSVEGQPLGCVALRPLPLAGCCEMKRLYVSAQGRGRGLGRALVRSVIAEAERIGYTEIRLDSLPDMRAAIALYRAEGFTAMPAYYETPVAGTVFLRRSLSPRTG